MIDGSTIFLFFNLYLLEQIYCYVILDMNRTHKIDDRLDIFRESVRVFVPQAFPRDNDIRITPSDHPLPAGPRSCFAPSGHAVGHTATTLQLVRDSLHNVNFYFFD